MKLKLGVWQLQFHTSYRWCKWALGGILTCDEKLVLSDGQCAEAGKPADAVLRLIFYYWLSTKKPNNLYKYLLLTNWQSVKEILKNKLLSLPYFFPSKF